MLSTEQDKVQRMLLLWHHKVLLSGGLHGLHQLLVDKIWRKKLTVRNHLQEQLWLSGGHLTQPSLISL